MKFMQLSIWDLRVKENGGCVQRHRQKDITKKQHKEHPKPAKTWRPTPETSRPKAGAEKSKICPEDSRGEHTGTPRNSSE